MRAWVKQTCKFCGRELEGILPACTCDGWEDAEALRQAEWEEEHKNDPQEEDFDEVYPVIYHAKSEIEVDAGSEKVGDCIAVEARQYKDGVGICIYLPFWDEDKAEWDDSGLCFDLPEEMLERLRDLLSEASDAIQQEKKK